VSSEAPGGRPRAEPGTVGVLVMAHGTPQRLTDLGAFYTEIRRGHPPSPEQLSDLERRYRAIGGPSPLNAITEAQARGVATALERRRPGRYCVRHGTRFSAPRLEDAVHALADAGVGRVVGLVLAPHSSLASVAEYARRAEAAAGAAGSRRQCDLPLTMIDHWYDTPGFAELVAGRVQAALSSLPEGAAGEPSVVFSAHSVPAALVGAGDTYAEQVAASAASAASAAGVRRWTTAWQSAGRTEAEWLGPDLRDVIASEAATGASAVVVCPIGFVADHLEVLYDVDVEARSAADAAGVAFARTASFNDDAQLCALLAGVVCTATEASSP
jgi:protoporphyrin/coproporphyrin ferrochelatase